MKLATVSPRKLAASAAGATLIGAGAAAVPLLAGAPAAVPAVAVAAHQAKPKMVYDAKPKMVYDAVRSGRAAASIRIVLTSCNKMVYDGCN